MEIGIRAQRRGAGEQGAHLVGGISHRGEGDGLAAHSQKRGQPGDGLFGADHREHTVNLHVIAASERGGDGLAQLRGAGGLRVTRVLRGCGQRKLHAWGYRVNGVAHREVNDSTRVGLGLFLGAGQRIPGEVWKRLS